MRVPPTLVLALALTAPACTFDPRVPALGGADASSFVDGSLTVETTGDAGPTPDAGPARDAGAEPDAGPRADAGFLADAGFPADAGVSTDAGRPTDAGVATDAGFPDSGIDAGFPCGNGVLVPPEACDDGNYVNGDGCNTACEVERGYGCEGSPSICQALPQLDIQSTSTTEGQPARFTVTLSTPAPFDVSFTWSTADDTASDGLDYNGVSQSMLLIARGAQAAELVVDTLSDTDFEGPERFSVALSNVTGAVEGVLVAEATIEDVPVLSSQGLVVRYYLDDEAPGTTASTVLDSAPDPLSLSAIIDHDRPEHTEETTGRGLNWDREGRNGRVSALVGNSKVETAVDNARQGTIECVARVVDTANASRLLHLGGAELGRFSFLVAADLYLAFNNELYSWTFPMSARNRRAVFTLVVDTNDSTAEDRQRLYIDGVDQGPASDSIPSRERIDFPSYARALVIGNRTGGGYSLEGDIYYCALYSVALDPAEVARNAAVLLNRDDP